MLAFAADASAAGASGTTDRMVTGAFENAAPDLRAPLDRDRRSAE